MTGGWALTRSCCQQVRFHIIAGVDYFTVSLHCSNGRQIACRWGCARDCEWQRNSLFPLVIWAHNALQAHVSCPCSPTANLFALCNSLGSAWDHLPMFRNAANYLWNSLWPSDAVWYHRFGSTVDETVAPSDSMCWCIEVWRKWLTFGRQHFQMHIFWRK